MRPLASIGAPFILAVGLMASDEGFRPPLGLDLYRPVPESNPLTRDKIALGRRLFHDRRLSRDGSKACASCHDPSRAFTDAGAVSVGVGGAVGRRNAPTLINRAWGARFFWDGRAGSLEQQVLQPLFNPIELGGSRDAVMRVVRSAEYAPAVQRAFPGESSAIDVVARALASYVRTVVAGDSPYDRFASGRSSAISPAARRGLNLFTGIAGCLSCHFGPTLTDEGFHNTGVAWTGGEFADLGRGGITGRERDRGAFKTPTLREVTRTAPYMHDGSLATLDDVLEFYDRGGRPNPYLDSRIRPLQLTSSQKTDLIAFLRSLTGRLSDER